jgi:uncharacterized surface protein with fasciclin (FAS1) repeats
VKHRSPFRILGVVIVSIAVGVAAIGGTAVAGSKAKQPKTVVAVAKSSSDFSTLVTAVGAAELVKALSGKGPFTVFAPTNAAFAKIPKASLDALVADKSALAKVLTYHVIQGRVMAKDLMPTQTVKTLEGENITIAVNSNGTATITDAKGNVANITATDLKAKNGVVHVIDSVLQPAG